MSFGQLGASFGSLGLGALGSPGPSFSATNLPIWSAAVRAAMAGTADAVALHVGNSTVTGVGGGGVSGSLDGNAKAVNPCSQLATRFAARAVPIAASAATVYGNARRTSAAQYNAYDNRAVFAGTWTAAADSAQIGGGYLSAATTATLTYDLGQACDRLELSARTQNAGTFNVVVGGITQALVDTTAGPHQTITIPAGTTSVDLVWVSGTCRIFRIHGRSTTARRVIFNSVGQPGQKLSDAAGTAANYATKNVITSLAPKLVILDSWINEAAATQDEATYKAAYQGFIDVIKAVGSDILLFGGHHTSGGAVARPNYMTWLSDLATLNSVPFFDIATYSAQWASYAAASSAGYMDADGLHLNATGNPAKGDALYSRING